MPEASTNRVICPMGDPSLDATPIPVFAGTGGDTVTWSRGGAVTTGMCAGGSDAVSTGGAKTAVTVLGASGWG